jgi:hypothetical protein
MPADELDTTDSRPVPLRNVTEQSLYQQSFTNPQTGQEAITLGYIGAGRYLSVDLDVMRRALPHLLRKWYDEPDLRDTIARIAEASLRDLGPDQVPAAAVVRAAPSTDYLTDRMARDMYCASFAVDSIPDDGWDNDPNRQDYTRNARLALHWMQTNPDIAETVIGAAPADAPPTTGHDSAADEVIARARTAVEVITAHRQQIQHRDNERVRADELSRWHTSDDAIARHAGTELSGPGSSAGAAW